MLDMLSVTLYHTPSAANQGQRQGGGQMNAAHVKTEDVFGRHDTRNYSTQSTLVQDLCKLHCIHNIQRVVGALHCCTFLRCKMNENKIIVENICINHICA